jgi:hypothetical protein
MCNKKKRRKQMAAGNKKFIIVYLVLHIYMYSYSVTLGGIAIHVKLTLVKRY